MIRCTVRNNFDLKESGAALLELAIYVPILILLMYGIYETTRMIEVKHQMSTAVSELANRAYRECSFYEEPTGCMQTALNLVTSDYPQLGDDFQMIVSIYSRDLVTNDVILRGERAEGEGTFESRFDEQRIHDVFGDVVNPFKNLVIAEAFSQNSAFKIIVGGNAYELSAM